MGLYNTNRSFVGSVKLPAEKFANQEEDFTDSSQEKSLILNSADEIFTEIRDKHFFVVGQSLSRRAKQMSSQFDEGHGGRTVQEIKQFVAKLPQMLAVKKCLANRTNKLTCLLIKICFP